MGSTSLVKVGFGEEGRRNTTYWDDGQKTNVAKILISYSEDGVRAIQFSYSENGQFVLGQKHGTSSSDKFKMIHLDYPFEYIVRIRGHFNEYEITSISFVTNMRKYGPFGTKGESDDSPFNIYWEKKEYFGGFHGTLLNNDLRSIGVFIKQ